MSVPAPFTKCPNYYKPSVARFVVCTNVSDFCTYIADLHQIDLVLHWAIFIVPCVMCLLAFFMNMYNFYILIPMFKKLDDLTKKRYVFLISRALSSTMSIIAIFMMPVAILFTDYNFWFMAVFMIFDMISFLSFLGGIVGTTLTFYVVIVHPVFYQRELSFRRCCQIVIVFWVCSAVVAIGCGTVQAAFMGTNAPFQCDYHTCEKPVLMIAIVIISVTFAFSLGIQSFVIFSLYRHEKKSKERGDFSSSSKKMRAVMKRLFSGFVIFLMMAVFEVTSAVILVQNVFSISDRSISLCEFLSASGSRLEFIIFCSVLTLLWATGLFLDPIFTMLFDPMFSEEFSTHVSTTIKRIQSKISTK